MDDRLGNMPKLRSKNQTNLYPEVPPLEESSDESKEEEENKKEAKEEAGKNPSWEERYGKEAKERLKMIKKKDHL